MKKHFLNVILLAFLTVFSVQANSALTVSTSQGIAGTRAADNGPKTVYINGNNESVSFFVSGGQTLSPDQVITIKIQGEFEASETELPYNVNNKEITVRLKSTKFVSTGEIYFIVGTQNVVKYELIGYASPLQKKDISQNPVLEDIQLGGTQETYEFFDSDGFEPTENGYTIEFTAKLPASISYIYPFGVTPAGAGFQGYTERGFNQGDPTEYNFMGLKNSIGYWGARIFSFNGKQFLTDEEFHTYRYAVTSNNDVYIYRNGNLLDVVRSSEFGLQPHFQDGEGDYEENLLINGDFEGAFDMYKSGRTDVAQYIQGWNIPCSDTWNSDQRLVREGAASGNDATNRVLRLDMYEWAESTWTDADVSQVVDVVPGETYTLSALAKGGKYAKTGEYTGKLKILALKGTEFVAAKEVQITSDNWEEYSLNYTAESNVKQIRVSLVVGRVDVNKRGHMHSMKVDDVKLVGKRASYLQKLGFMGRAAEIGYFNFDATGAYAPATGITTSAKSLSFDKFKQSLTLTVTPEGLSNDIMLIAPEEFILSTDEIPAGSGATNVTITYNSTTPTAKKGILTLKCGEFSSFVELNAISNYILEEKDISKDAIIEEVELTGALETYEFFDTDGFEPTGNGYTIEFSAKLPASISSVQPFAVIPDGVGFQAFTEMGYKKEDPTEYNILGIKNSVSYWGAANFSNKAAAESGNTSADFYPNDEFHVYRYAVTPDNQMYTYRDGVLLGRSVLSSYGSQPHFQDGEGEYEENLLINSDFESVDYEYVSEEPESGVLASVKGWNIVPMDRWNSEQFIEKQMIDSKDNPENHIISLGRYAWQEGWTDCEMGQYVDVVPGETYTFSAMAKGGIHKGLNLGSLKLQEVKNGALDEANTKKVEVTSENWEEYSINYTAAASVKQIRVLFSIAKGSTWGSSPKIYVDKAKVIGKRVEKQQKVGFIGRAASIGYFNYDVTGAYAPIAGLNIGSPSSIDTPSSFDAITTDIRSGLLYVNNVPESSIVSVYNVGGSLISNIKNYAGSGIPLPQQGFYVVYVKFNNEIYSLKVVY